MQLVKSLANGPKCLRNETPGAVLFEGITVMDRSASIAAKAIWPYEEAGTWREIRSRRRLLGGKGFNLKTVSGLQRSRDYLPLSGNIP